MSEYNVLYMICHDLSEHLGCYGYDYVESPNLDRLAEDGVRFTNAFLNSTPCSPARGCIQTGMYAHNNGLTGLAHRGFNLPEERRTITDELNDAGIDTIHYGFQHERHPREGNPNRYKEDWVESNDAKDVCAKVVEFLEKRKPEDGRFYLNAGFSEVHLTFNRDYYDFTEGADDVVTPSYLPDTETMRQELANFNASIRYMDQAIGTVLEALERTGHAENTVVVFTTDHGMAFPRCKSTMYDSGTKVALMLRPPKGAEGFAAPAVIDGLVSHIDIMPTLLEIFGVDTPEYCQGISLMPMLRGEIDKLREECFMEKNVHEHYDPIRSIRTERFRYIRSFEEAPYLVLPGDIVKSIASDELPDEWFEARAEEELYDLQADPGETRNIAGVKAYSEVLDDMRGRLNAWMEETDDPLLKDGVMPFPDDAVMSELPPVGYNTGRYGNIPQLTNKISGRELHEKLSARKKS